MQNSFIKNNSDLSDKEINIKSDINSKSNSERIAKRIARSGLCSRREAERWILNGQVKLNNKTLTECGINVTKDDIIEVNGEILPEKVNTKLWIYHKERGYLVTNNDPEGRPTIFDELKSKKYKKIALRIVVGNACLLITTSSLGKFKFWKAKKVISELFNAS